MNESVFPAWLHAIAVLSLLIAIGCALFIAFDEMRRPQHMGIMNIVWPLTALFGSVLWLVFYLRHGRGMTRQEHRRMQSHGGDMTLDTTGMPVAVAKGASHCGAGCTLGDIVAEWLAFSLPTIAVWFGWQWLFEEKMFAVWVLDYILAFAIGIVFQYYSIKPMRDLTPSQGLVQAVKADAASITSWQVGMYGFMAIAQFLWFRPLYGGMAEVDTPEFWFAMQIAMLCGFCTSYPVNWLLVRSGIKEKM